MRTSGKDVNGKVGPMGSNSTLDRSVSVLQKSHRSAPGHERVT